MGPAASFVTIGCGASSLPAAAIAHNEAGAVHLRQGELDEAEARFRLALEYHPSFAEPHANLGLVALARGDLDAAATELRAAVELNPDFALAWNGLGVVFDRQRRGDDARRAFERALSIDPGTEGARRNLAAWLVTHGELAEARAHLMRLVELGPSDAQVRAWLAYVELRLGRPAAAFERAEVALRLDPSLGPARMVRGAARARRGDLDGAALDLASAANDPVVGHDARTRLAAVRLLQGQISEAQSLARDAVLERDDDAAPHLVLAMALLEQGDRAGAVRAARRALVLMPDLTAAHEVLERAEQSR